MNPTSATTNSQGLVQTVINSGTVAASVRVTATISGSTPAISTQSSNLVVSTGIPDQDSFTLAASVLNPEAWNLVGTTVEVSAYLADGFNNPVPDGTVVSFSTEGGRIDPSCTTIDGTCTVIWNSQSPFPTGETHDTAGNGPSADNRFLGGTNPFSLGQPYGGRATIIATAIGEESFPDSNGNGRFDESELTTFLNSTDVEGNPFDLDEAYRDHNEDGFFNPWETDPAEEPAGDLEILVDFDGDNNWTQSDSLYNGVLCSIPEHAGCSSQKSLHVRAQIVIVMAGSEPYTRVTSTIDAPTDPLNDDPNDTTIHLAPEAQGLGTVVLSDLHNQPLPAGTTVSFEATIGSLQGTSSFEVPSTNKNGGLDFSFSIKAPTEPGTGSVNIIVTTPSGLQTVVGVISVVVQ